ncbi:MAG: ATP-binding protein [Alphaproteobacteria bacterium]
MSTQTDPKSTAFQGLFGALSGSKKLQAEKARLEAFLAAVPGEYCGISRDGSIVYSKGFCVLLGLERVMNLTDIQNQLTPSDAAALEGLYTRLAEDAISFTLNVQDHPGKRTLKITGVRGVDTEDQDYFNILWLEDVTEQYEASVTFAEEQKAQFEEIERLQDSLDGLPFPVWIRNALQEILWVNVAYAKKTGARPSEILSQQKEIAQQPRKKKPGAKEGLLGSELAKKALECGVTQATKAHVVIGGNRLLVRVTETPLKAQKLTMGVLEDLSPEEALETELKNFQEAQRGLLGQLRSAVAFYGPEQTLEFYNTPFAQLWTLEEGWLNTKPKLGDILEKLREMRRLPEQADFRKYKKSWLDKFTDLIEPYEDMLYLPNGNAIRMLMVPQKAGGLMMNFEDVTSRLELESSYNTLIAVQKETLDNLAEGVAVFGGDGRLKLWNPSFARLWGLHPEDLEGEPHITRIVEKMKGFFDASQWESTRDALIGLALERTMHEGRQKRADDSLLDFITVPLPDGGVLVTFTDVTDSVRVENALREKNAALEAAEKLKLDFLANVSYQLRTPLNAIMGFNEILDQEFFGALNPKQKEYTRDIRESSERLLALVNDILDLSSFEAGYMELQISRVDIRGMLQAIVDLVEDWARKQEIALVLKCPEGIGSAEIDETRMKQAVLNVVQNALAHTRSGGHITINAQADQKTLILTVQDNGVGIPAAEQSRILQPFERIESQQAGRGVGLGLTLVQNIVTLHGGDFRLESAPEKGTTVTLRVPLSQSP